MGGSRSAGDVSVRFSVQDAEVVRKALEQLGKDGQAALVKIDAAGQKPSQGLKALSAVMGDLRGQAQSAGGGLGIVSTGLLALGSAGLVVAATAGSAYLLFSTIKDGAKEFGVFSRQVRDNAEAVGLSNEQFQAAVLILQRHGVEEEKAAGILAKLAKAREEAAHAEGALYNAMKEQDAPLARQFALSTSLAQATDIFGRALANATEKQKVFLMNAAGGRGSALAIGGFQEIFDKGGIEAATEALVKFGIVFQNNVIDKQAAVATAAQQKAQEVQREWDAIFAAIIAKYKEFKKDTLGLDPAAELKAVIKIRAVAESGSEGMMQLLMRAFGFGSSAGGIAGPDVDFGSAGNSALRLGAGNPAWTTPGPAFQYPTAQYSSRTLAQFGAIDQDSAAGLRQAEQIGSAIGDKVEAVLRPVLNPMINAITGRYSSTGSFPEGSEEAEFLRSIARGREVLDALSVAGYSLGAGRFLTAPEAVAGTTATSAFGTHTIDAMNLGVELLPGRVAKEIKKTFETSAEEIAQKAVAGGPSSASEIVVNATSPTIVVNGSNIAGAGVGGADINNNLRRELAPTAAAPTASAIVAAGPTDEQIKTDLRIEIQREKQRAGLLGGLTPDSERLATQRKELDLARRENSALGITDPQADRINSRNALQQDNQRAHERVALLGDMATVTERVGARNNALNLSLMNGARISADEATKIIASNLLKEQAVDLAARERLGIATDKEILDIKLRQLDVEGRLFKSTEERATAERIVRREVIETANAIKIRASDAPALTRLSLDSENLAKSLDTNLAGALQGATSDLVAMTRGTETLSQGLRNLSGRFIDAALQAVFMRTIIGPIAGGIAGLFGGGAAATAGTFNAGDAALNLRLFPGLGTASALGNVFDRGLIPFALGGVINRPTYFKFANGGGFSRGLAGEAGPEAILPLARGPDGALGVRGGGGMVVHQHFYLDGAMTKDDVKSMVVQGASAAVRESKSFTLGTIKQYDKGSVSRLQQKRALEG